MKLFIASDLHGCAISTEKMLTLFDKSEASHLVLLGDYLNHGPRNAIPTGYDPLRVAELLNKYADRILAVRGNCDSEVDQALLAFPMMSTNHTILLASGRRLFVSHGHLFSRENVPPLQSGDVFISGHTHIAVVENDEVSGIHFFNPGSISLPRNNESASYGVLENNLFKVLDLNGVLLRQMAL